MSKELELYKAFIDGLVERKDSMTALWVKGDGFPKTEDNKAKNDFLATLTPEQKDVLAEMLQDEHIAGIHDTLAYINEMMDLEGLELHQDGESLSLIHIFHREQDLIEALTKEQARIRAENGLPQRDRFCGIMIDCLTRGVMPFAEGNKNAPYCLSLRHI